MTRCTLWLLKLVHQLVQMRVATQNQALTRAVNRIDVDLPAAVADSVPLEAHFVGQRVDKPGLTLSLSPDLGDRLGGEALAGLTRVLIEQLPDLGFAEVAQAQGLRLDVEGAPTQDGIPLGRRVDAVVAHVTHATQHHALGKPPRAVGVASAELPQHGDQGVADQRVDLVDQQHQRLATRGRPPRQGAV